MDKLLDEATMYLYDVKASMEWLARKKNIIFIGQTVNYDGSPMFKSLSDVPKEKKMEFPVAEDMQMGISIGLSLGGFIPVSIYPRIDFLICATDQLVNHLNHCEEMSNGQFKPGVIIRTQIGNTEPIYPGVQHCSDHTEALKLLCPNIKVIKLEKLKDVQKSYIEAYKRAKRGKSTILVEMPQGHLNANAYKK